MSGKTRMATLLLAMALAIGGLLAGCSQNTDNTSENGSSTAQSTAPDNTTDADGAAKDDGAEGSVNASAGGSLLDTSDMFSKRDLEQVADTSSAENLAIASGTDTQVTAEGVYVVSGQASDATIVVDAPDDAKVQLVLDGITVDNESKPAIYVKNADKVFVTTLKGTTSTLATTGSFAAIEDEDVDAVVYAKDDITFNGEGTLVIKSTATGIRGKDEVTITGGTYDVDAAEHAVKGKDSVAVADGSFTLKAGKDGIHSANSDKPEKGYVYIAGGAFDISAGSDGIEGDNAVQIDDGDIDINASEGIEGTYVQINGGAVSIKASDDGINAAAKSTARPTPTIEINGGKVTIDMGQGDTDALDSNGALYINGGTVDITAQFAFDFNTEGKLNGGEVTVNGEKVSEITESMQMGGGMGGRMSGMRGGDGDNSAGMGNMRFKDGEEPPEMPDGEAPDGNSRQKPDGQRGGKDGGRGFSGSGSGRTPGSDQPMRDSSGTGAATA